MSGSCDDNTSPRRPSSMIDVFERAPGSATRRPSSVSAPWRRGLLLAVVVSITFAACPSIAAEPAGRTQGDTIVGEELPTGKTITPTAAKGAIFLDLNPGHPAAPNVRASQAAAIAVSPDGKILAILTSGFNIYFGADGKKIPDLSTEYVFLFDITGPKPRQRQVLPLPHAFQGLAWASKSDRIFASGGRDDTVVEFVLHGSNFAVGRTFALGHKSCVGREKVSPGIIWAERCGVELGGLAVSLDGTRLLVSNLQNDSVSLIDLESGRVIAEQDLRPGIIDSKRHGEPGGSFPRTVAWTSSHHAYVASARDREVISLAISGSKISVLRRMPVHGQPAALLASGSGSRLYVALDTTDQVAIFDTAHDRLIESLDVTAPASIYANTKMLGGANTNALTLTPDERTLLVSNGGENAIAVVQLSDSSRGATATAEKKSTRQRDRSGDDDEKPRLDHSAVVGMVPTGWYPTGVATSNDGATWFVVNGKSPSGPNVGWCQTTDPDQKLCAPANSFHSLAPADSGWAASKSGWDLLIASNQFVDQLEKAGFLTFPAPQSLELARLTKRVARNNRFDQPEKTAADGRLFAFLREHIKHVIYIIKENRTYDQVLGDLEIGNGDTRLTLFPEKNTPNHHAIARNFVTLDNLLLSGEGSWTGWDWTLAAQTTDLEERAEPLTMPGRGLKNENGLQTGSSWHNRGINVGYATSQERRAVDPSSPADPDILPGARNVFAPDGPGGEEGKGFLWDAALRRGRTVRSWGVFASGVAQSVREPFAQNKKVSWGTTPSLIPYTDQYYPYPMVGFPDYWHLKEWKREFAEFSTAGHAPDLMLLWLPGDHLGDFDHEIDGVNTPETQIADNDYAVGLLIETVANSPFAKDTLIIAIEDDACDGPDHVDAHRSIALFAGPYVRQHALISTGYTTVSVVKTIEEILGIGPIGLNDALAAPMSDVFDAGATTWSYQAIVPDVLRSTKLPLPPDEHAKVAFPRHVAAYWAKTMAGQDFSGPDRVDPLTFNRALWRGLKGDEPYPVVARHLIKSMESGAIPY